MTPSQLRRIINQEVRRAIIAESRVRNGHSLRFLLEAEDGEEAPKLNMSKGPSSTIEWLNGPGADPRVRALLNSGRLDGKPEDEKAAISETEATVGELVPTQVEIELTKSIAFPLSKFDSLKKMISGGVQRVGPPGNDTIVISGNLIVDGHHRWSSLFSVAGPSGQIAAVNISLPEKDAPSVLSIVQTAIAATLTGGESVPKAKTGGMNILGKGRDELVQLITAATGKSGEAGEILSDDFVQKCMKDPQVSKHFDLSSAKDVKSARATIIQKVADNLSQMNQPAEGSPPRVDMPQLDQAKGGAKGALDKLAAGKVNYKAPFGALKNDEDDSTQKEAAVRKGQAVILERWHRIAGIKR